MATLAHRIARYEREERLTRLALVHEQATPTGEYASTRRYLEHVGLQLADLRARLVARTRAAAAISKQAPGVSPQSSGRSPMPATRRAAPVPIGYFGLALPSPVVPPADDPELVVAWPLASDPKAPPSVLRKDAR